MILGDISALKFGRWKTGELLVCKQDGRYIHRVNNKTSQREVNEGAQACWGRRVARKDVEVYA